MAGPTYYHATVNIAVNEDWVVSFAYGSLDTDGVTLIPIDLTGSVLKMEIRKQEMEHEAIVAVTSNPNDGIIITDAVGGAFTIAITRDRLWRLAPGDYVTDFVRLAPNGYQERIFEGPATVVRGTTR